MLRLEIDGKWEPEDFIEVLTGVESLYYKAALVRRVFHEPLFYWFDRPYVPGSFDDHLNQTNDWLLARARDGSRPVSDEGGSNIVCLAGWDRPRGCGRGVQSG